MKPTTKPATIDAYLATFPEEVRNVLQKIRETIRKAAPEATESISYGIPTFNLNGALVHFAAFKNHVGFYATPTGHAAFAEELSGYKEGKGSVQFPLYKHLPLDLVSRIVAFRVKENLAKQTKKK
jgi:uncharacterized protein YdhG (YjbR/CyaY superfamily)